MLLEFKPEKNHGHSPQKAYNSLEGNSIVVL